MSDIVTFDRAALLLKTEVTYGTDSTPAGATDSMLIANGRIRFVANKLVREIDQAHMGAKPFLLTGRTAFLEFDLEVMGASTVDAAAPISPILTALGLAETITPTTGPVDYNPISSVFDSATGYFYIPSANASGGAQHVITGLRGTAVLTQGVNQFSKIRVTLQGNEAVITDVAMPTQTLSAFQVPVGCTTDTWTLTVAGYEVEGVELSLDFGQRVNMFETSKSKVIACVGRDSTGFLRIHDPAQVDLDAYALANSETPVAISSVVGTVATKTLTTTIAQAQLELPERIDIDGASGLRIPFTALPSAAGNDEFSLSFS